MRTLILGLPLPNPAFDNFSFLSAPSFSEYSQLLVDIGSASRAVDDVIGGAGVHATYGGQAIVNGPASSFAFPLADILAMRRREAEWVLSHGGSVVCIGYPEVPHVLAGGDTWRSYDWLPRPEGLSYQDDLLPGFGRPGAVLVDADHAFAPYVEQLARRIAYRLHVNEDAPELRESGSVFARSSGGQAIGFEIPLLEGRLVVLPALQKPEAERMATAGVVAECLERLSQARSPQPLESREEAL